MRRIVHSCHLHAGPWIRWKHVLDPWLLRELTIAKQLLSPHNKSWTYEKATTSLTEAGFSCLLCVVSVRLNVPIYPIPISRAFTHFFTSNDCLCRLDSLRRVFLFFSFYHSNRAISCVRVWLVPWHADTGKCFFFSSSISFFYHFFTFLLLLN